MIEIALLKALGLSPESAAIVMEEITRLRSDNARLRDALKPFAAHAGLFGPDDATCEIEVSFGALRMALSAINS